MADETPPIRPPDASSLERAADAAMAKAKQTSAQIDDATGATRGAKAELEAADRRLGDLEREWEEARRLNKKLSAHQRALLDEIAGGDVGREPRTLGQQSTLKALQRRELVQWEGSRLALTEKGQGVQNPERLREQRTQAAPAKPIPLPEGPAASQQRAEQRRAAQEAAWDDELQKFKAREESKTQTVEQQEAVRFRVRTRSQKLLDEFGYYSETHGDSPGAENQAVGRAYGRAAGGEGMARQEAELLRQEIRTHLAEGGMWNPAHQWGGTGKPMPGVRKAAESVLRQLDEQLAGTEKVEQAKTAAVQRGAEQRVQIGRDETAALAGNTAEAERIIAQHADVLRRELGPQQTAAFEQATQPTPEAQREQAAARLREQQQAEQRAFLQRIGATPVTGDRPEHGPSRTGFDTYVKELARQQELAARRAERDTARQAARAAAPPPPPPPPTPPAPPSEPPDDPEERKRLMQRLTDALGRRAAEQERMAADAAAERVETRVRRQQSKLQENAYVRAEAARRQRVQQMYEAGAGQYPQGAGPETGAAYAQQQRELEAWQQMRARMFREGGVYPGNQLIPQRGMPTWMRLAQATREVAAAPGGQLIPQAQLPSFIGRPRALNVPQQTPTAADATRAARATDLQGRAAGRAAGAHSQNAQAITAEAEAIAQAQGTYDRWAASSRGLASELDRTSIAADLSSQRFRKHGALTTEFIEAAAKGEVTLRELGYQLTATIGKFAGWTGAATLVYGAVGAFSELSKGAIAAESSVGLVSRVVTRDFSTGALKQDLRGLSAEFNVSMQDAADAVYGAGKTFHDLPGAVEGARTALFAMKVGELDAATATDSLASIVRGFQLQASDLPGVLDTINQATNRYGGNVGNLVQGVARAAGQFKLAGGSYRELVAILTAGSRLTGASAQEVGTAVGRMVSTVHTAAGATRARAAGLDPTLDPLALVQQAQRLARGASPERVQELARAIIPTGGQYARIFVPLIQNARLLNSVLDDTTPEKSKGSAQRELAKVLSQANEQLKKVANSLQQLGAALAQAGLLTPFLALIRVTNLAITGVTKLLELFDRVVPDPFQKPLGTLLELYGVLRLLRRFDVGGQIAAGGRLEGLRQYVSAGPQRQTQRQIFQGISAQQRFLGDTRERVGQQAALVTFREQQAGRRFQQAEAAGDAALMERRAAQLQRVSEQAADLVDEEADLRRLINETDQRRIDTLRGIRQGMTAEQAFLAAGGTYRTAGFDRPTTQGPEQVGEPAPRREPFVPIAAGTTGRPRDVTRYIDEVEALAAAEGETAVRARGIQQGLGKLGTAGSALGGAAAGGVRAAQAARAGMGAAGAGIGRLALALGAALGPLDYALLGLVAVYEVIGLAQKASAQHAEQIRRAQQSTASPEQIRRNVADLPTQEDIRRQTVSARGPIAVTTQARRDAALRARQEARARDLARQQDVGRLLDLPTIQQRYRTQQSTAGSRRQQFSAIQQALGELGQSYYAVYGQRDLAAAQRRGDKGEVARVQSAIKAVDDYRDYLNSAQNALASLGGEISQALAAAKTFDQLNAFIDTQTANFELAGGRGKAGHAAGRALGRAAVRAAQLFGQTNDPVAYLKTLKGIADTTTTQAENQLKRLLDAAKTPAQRRQAYRTAYRGLRVQLGIPEQQAQLEQVRGQQGERQRQINELQSRQRLARLVQQPAADPLTGTTLGGLPAGLTERQQARLRKLVQAYAQGTREERALAKGIRYMQQAFRDIKQQDDQANAEALFAAQTAVGAANQPAGAARIRFLIVRAGIAVRNAIRAHGRSSVEALQAINEQQQLMAQAVQEQASIIQANAALAEANATTPHGEFLANVGGLNNLLALQRANPKVYSPADNTQLQAQIQGATKSENQRLAEDAKQKREEAEQKAKDLIEARYGYLESLTDDPLKIARLEEQKATALLAHAKDPAERYQALAARNQARRDRQNAYYQRRQDELDLQHDVGRLSDQAYLRGLERLWHRMQRGSQAWRDMRAKILRFKHDMENAADDMPELNVGNIRLPTVYDVRRIIRQGTQTNVVQHNVVNVDARGQDPQAVVAHLHRHFGSQTKAGMRAAGVRG